MERLAFKMYLNEGQKKNTEKDIMHYGPNYTNS